MHSHSCTHRYMHMHRRHTYSMYVDTPIHHTHKDIYFHTAACCVESVPAIQPQGNGELMDRTKIQLPTQSSRCPSIPLSMWQGLEERPPSGLLCYIHMALSAEIMTKIILIFRTLVEMWYAQDYFFVVVVVANLTATAFWTNTLAAACDWHLRGDFKVVFKNNKQRDGAGETLCYVYMVLALALILLDMMTDELLVCEEEKSVCVTFVPCKDCCAYLSWQPAFRLCCDSLHEQQLIKKQTLICFSKQGSW